MRTRSSRFFVVLLHLIGAPPYDWWVAQIPYGSSSTSNETQQSTLSLLLQRYQQKNGIVGVHPWPVVMEKVSTLAVAGNSHEPVWLQASTLSTPSNKASATDIPINSNSRKRRMNKSAPASDTKGCNSSSNSNSNDSYLCLGPTGDLTTCGDATQWWVVPVPAPPRAKLGLFGVDDGYDYDNSDSNNKNGDDDFFVSASNWPKDAVAFCVVDREYETAEDYLSTLSKHQSRKVNFVRRWWRRRQARKKQRQNEAQMECLLHSSSPDEAMLRVATVPDKTALYTQRAWRLRDNGQLQAVYLADRKPKSLTTNFKKNKRNSHKDNKEHKNLKDDSLHHESSKRMCVHYDDDSLQKITLKGCSNVDEETAASQIDFSLMRYHVTTAPSMLESKEIKQVDTEKETDKRKVSTNGTNLSDSQNQDESSSNREAEGEDEEEENNVAASNLPLRHRDRAHSRACTSDSTSSSPHTKTAARGVMSLNPSHHYYPSIEDSPSYASALHNINPILLAGSNLGSASTTKFNSASKEKKKGGASSSMKTAMGRSHQPAARRMQMHPYLVAAKDEVWTDPQTGLSFPTDLRPYLGYSHEESGRHTLTGFGIFRKGYVIKIYGIAFYVSKRDVLTDPAFTPFVDLSVDELRQRPDFYQLLRTHGENGVGTFERTLIIKTNMQLAAETISKSLEADWKMLTDEGKHLLTRASLDSRPANDNALKIVQSKDNPNRCSCSRLAPDQYQADPKCCARGTELAFTWRKNGNLVIRLDGQFVDEFNRPDIAEGIFFEYLRLDDPMSTEFTDRVVEGFPFLLAPLAQVKGVNLGHQHIGKQNLTPNSFIANVASWFSAIPSKSTEMMVGIQQGFTHLVSDSRNVAASVTDFSYSSWKEIDRRREILSHHIFALPDVFHRMISHKRTEPESDLQALQANSTPSLEDAELLRRYSSGRVFGYPLSQWFGDVYCAPDEIGPMVISPTMDVTRKSFLTLVHLYLLLLFVVSFPGAHTTRTRLLVRKCQSVKELSESESEDSGDDLSPVKVKMERGKGILRHYDLPSTHKNGGASKLFSRHNTWRQDQVLETSPPTPLKKKSISYFL